MPPADCNMELVLVESRPADWEVAELNRRAGVLVREALANWAAPVQRMHWQDIQQTGWVAGSFIAEGAAGKRP